MKTIPPTTRNPSTMALGGLMAFGLNLRPATAWYWEGGTVILNGQSDHPTKADCLATDPRKRRRVLRVGMKPAQKSVSHSITMYSYGDNKKGLAKTNPCMAGMEERWQNGTMATSCQPKPAGVFPIAFQEKVLGQLNGRGARNCRQIVN